MIGKVAALIRYTFPRAGCVDGPAIAKYEGAFAEAVGASHAVGFWKGRVAFFAALRALGVGEGDEVVMPAYTCLVIPAAVTFLKAKPAYVDIEPVYCTMDPDKLSAALTGRTKVIMIQHTYGWPSFALDRVMDLAKAKGLPVIEDCCHALGTRQNGRHVGNFGVSGFFSTQWSKPFTTGLGGLLVCNDQEFHEQVLRVRDAEARWPGPAASAQLAAQGIVHSLLVYPQTTSIVRGVYRWLTKRSILTGSTARAEYCGWQPGYFQRMCAVQAAAGLFELQHLGALLDHRRRITEYYLRALHEMGWPMPPWPENADVYLLRVPVRVANKKEALQAADHQGIELGDWFVRPLHSHLAAQEDFGYVTGMCPNADRAAGEIVNLPTHPRVSLKHAERVIRFLRDRCLPTG